MKRLSHLATRIFGSPLLIHPAKLDQILRVLGPRIGLGAVSADAPEMPMPPDEDMPDDPHEHRNVPESIAVIDVFGPLVKRPSGLALSGGPTTYTEIEEQFIEAAADPRVTGILLNIDSPGGEVGGAFELADLIYQERGRKPCYAVANDDAMSAAYLMACAAEKVFVTGVGGCGSIGVRALHVDQSAFDAKIGVKYTYVTAGARKADLNPHEPISDEAQAWLQAEVDRLYGMFVSAVSRNRKMTPASVRATEAAVYFGPNAVAEGLADQVGTFQDAVNALSAAAGATQSSSMVASATNSRMEVTMPEDTKPLAEAQPEAPAAEQQPAEPVAAAEPAPAPQPEPVAATVGEIVAAAVAEAETRIRAEYEALAEMAVLAGQPGINLLPELIRGRVTADAARSRMLAAKAGASGPEISSRVGMADGGVEQQYKVLAESRAKEKGISFHQAYVQVVTENPKLYEQYLAGRQAIQTK